MIGLEWVGDRWVGAVMIWIVPSESWIGIFFILNSELKNIVNSQFQAEMLFVLNSKLKAVSFQQEEEYWERRPAVDKNEVRQSQFTLSEFFN